MKGGIGLPEANGKVKRNRTLRCTPQEEKALLSRCISVEKDISFTEIENRVILGDSFAVLPHLPAGFVDLLIVDAPYNMSKILHA